MAFFKRRMGPALLVLSCVLAGSSRAWLPELAVALVMLDLALIVTLPRLLAEEEAVARAGLAVKPAADLEPGQLRRAA